MNQMKTFYITVEIKETKNSKQQEGQDVIAVSSLGHEEGLTSKSLMEKKTLYT